MDISVRTTHTTATVLIRSDFIGDEIDLNQENFPDTDPTASEIILPNCAREITFAVIVIPST